MATDVKKIKFVYFVHVHPKAFHLTGYKQNLFFFLPLPAILKYYLRSLVSVKPIMHVQNVSQFSRACNFSDVIRRRLVPFLY